VRSTPSGRAEPLAITETRAIDAAPRQLAFKGLLGRRGVHLDTICEMLNRG